MDITAIVLAAGKGTRMKSGRNKMLHDISGMAMLEHTLDTAENVADRVVCVVGHQAERVKEAISGREKVDFVRQEEQLGTGHAVKQAESYISGTGDHFLVMYGDTPLLKSETLETLLDSHRSKEAGMSLLTAEVEDPRGYGRILRDERGNIERIVEDSDAGEEISSINEINAGVYIFEGGHLRDVLAGLENDNIQGEYYLTDAPEIIYEETSIASSRPESIEEILGVNTRSDLARAEEIMQKRVKKYHMNKGVTLKDPDRIYIEKNVEIGRDVTIWPGAVIREGTRIGRQCCIGPNCQLKGAELAEGVNVKQGSFIIQSSVGANTDVGPYAHLRPGNEIAESCRIGNFVEIKKSQVGKASKVPHLSYVGDGIIGEGCNIGAGTIFANYDGEKKHRTELEDGVFVGSNTTLVAPLKLGRKARTGAGSVVTKDVKAKTTVLGVPARFHCKNE